MLENSPDRQSADNKAFSYMVWKIELDILHLYLTEYLSYRICTEKSSSTSSKSYNNFIKVVERTRRETKSNGQENSVYEKSN